MKACYVNLAGGLGNQLFQIANGYAYAKRCNKHLFVDSKNWSASQGLDPSGYQYSIFKEFKYGSPTREVVPYHEPKFNYVEIPCKNGDIALNGYFQSLKYFQPNVNEFIGKLRLPEVRTDWIEEKNVAMHVRRGDYLAHQNIHLVCKREYFLRCLSKFEGYQVNVFTDSPEFVQQEFNDVNFNIIQTGDELKDLTLMSLHDNMICSNSSFSWWASLLSKKKNKILVPDSWFKNFEEHGDIYRDDFTRIEI